jgi:cytochrome c556
MRHRFLSTFTALILVLGFSIQVAAETSAEDSFKYRKSIMKALSGHAGAISMQARGLAGNPDYVAKHAKAIASLGSELHTLFAEGSNVEDSETLPIVWEEPEEFAEAIAAAEEATAALGEVADGGDMKAIGAAFRNVGKACKGCHDRFREEHDN